MVKISPRTALLAAAFSLCQISAAAAQTYTYTSIVVPNSVFTVVVAVNAGGSVLGAWYDDTFTEHGFLYEAGTLTTFDDPNAVNGTIPTDINAKGEVVGGYFDANYTEHGFTYTVSKKGKPEFTDVDAPGSASTSLVAIDSAGALYGDGAGVDNAQYIFLDKKGTFSTEISQNSPVVFGSSDNGNLAGAYYSSFPAFGWVYVKGKVTSLPTAGYNGNTAFGINKSGVAVGSVTNTSYVSSGFIFSKGTLTTYSEPNEVNTVFTGINDSGTICGYAEDSTYTTTSFTFAGGTYTPVAVPGGTYTTATAINAAGQVVGTYNDANGNQDVFLATPN